jgi:signal transduction histidine kinase
MANLSKLNPFTYISDSGPERFAVGRVNVLLAKIFAIGGLAVGLQMLVNAWIQQDLLNPYIFWPGFLAVGVGQLGLIYGAFISGKNQFWQRWYAFSIAAVIFSWFLAIHPDAVLDDSFYPWAWWGVGLAGVAGVAGLAPFTAIVFYVTLDAFWFIARFYPAYGATTPWLNIQDTLLTFLFAALLGSLIFITRYEASKVDEAASLAFDAATQQARVEAEVREKSRLDALVHDKVLTTLILAAKADSPQEEKAVADLAVKAITQLNQSPSRDSVGEVTGTNFIEALEKIAKSQAPEISLSRNASEPITISELVANALNEATLQAILNAQQHAGRGAAIELHSKVGRNSIKVVIKDSGRGFRMSRVPKNRLGVRVSIIERMESVGGRAFVDSRPGSGTSIILEWSQSA